jgi:rhodanese-related sulfurtransferase
MKQLLVFLLLIFPTALLADGDLLSPPDAWTLAEKGELTIIDVRTPPEWAWTGVPKTAHRSNWWQLSGRDGFLEDVLEIAGNHRNRRIALICARGVRSSEATRFLKEQGFTNVADIGEGMLGSRAGPGWLGRQLPLE